MLETQRPDNINNQKQLDSVVTPVKGIQLQCVTAERVSRRNQRSNRRLTYGHGIKNGDIRGHTGGLIHQPDPVLNTFLIGLHVTQEGQDEGHEQRQHEQPRDVDRPLPRQVHHHPPEKGEQSRVNVLPQWVAP